MIAITSQTYDLLGQVHLDGQPVVVRFDQRRTTVTRTLDGGVDIDDAGYNPGDRPREYLVRNPTEDQINRIQRMIKYHSDHKLYERGEVFKGALTISNYRPPELRISFNISEQEV